jgi:DNA polymerase-3 subunit epsilon
MVSLGLVLLTSLDRVGRDVTMRARHVHYIFDPGFKGSIDAEKVHGYDDWLLRHQDPFAVHADQIAELLASADLICAHNMDFDWSFIERAFGDLGRAAPSRPLFCTMEAARRSQRFHRASLRHVAGALGHRQPAVHSALHDAFLCMIVYLDLEMGLRWHEPIAGQEAPPGNLRSAPPRPEVLPRRKPRKRVIPAANPPPE